MLARKLRAATAAEAADPSWDLANAVYQGSPINYFSVGGQESNPNGFFFKPDGLKMYVIGSVKDNVNEYNLSTAWDISTASYSQLFSVAAQETTPSALFFKPDGLEMYITGAVTDAIWSYDFV